MRVRHLNDFEIQGLLDRRATAPESDVPGERYLKDLEAQEHLDNCPTCLAEVAMYRRLFGELDESNECHLPRNFASKVTFSLPPFRARRTKARLQMAGIWAVASMVSLAWFLSKLDWNGIVGKLSLYGVLKLTALKAWLTTVTGGLSLPSFDLVRFWKPVSNFTNSIEQALATDGSAVGFVVLTACVLILIASLDNLYLTSTRHHRKPH
ncbi:MAG: hypothetical protein J7J98_03800 [candidate division Zixibacteria bacterium]|nr:hypothetical protein [candidate division Zixibacteria bacterium]